MDVDGVAIDAQIRAPVLDSLRSKDAFGIDYHHSLFLHASDAPSSMSIGMPLLGMENYSLWREVMHLSLLTRNKFGFVDGSITRDTFGKDYELLWDHCNAVVKSWIMHNVSRILINGVLFRSSAHAIWEDLRERFYKVTTSRMFSLHRSIFTLGQGTLSVSAYYSKLKDLLDEYDSLMPPPCCDCVKSKDYTAHLQYQRLLQFLMGLNDGYAHARSQILMKSHIPNLNQAYAMVLQDETQKISAGNGRMDPTALFTARGLGFKSKKSGLECEFCHVKGHNKTQCFKLMKCSHCQLAGHLKENCYRLIGYPADFKSKHKDTAVTSNMVHADGNPTPDTVPVFTPEQYAQILGMLNKEVAGHQASAHMAGASLRASNANPSWIVDTGATNHMVEDSHLLTDHTKVGNTGKVQLPNGESTEITHVGNSHLAGGDVLKDVLCVPTFKFNLLSVSKATKQLNCCASFYPDFCTFQDLSDGRVKMIGREHGGLYWLREQHSNGHSLTGHSLMAKEVPDSELWHKRMGHVPLPVLKKIPTLINNCSVLGHCDICPMARQTRLPFKYSTTRSTACFELIHLDVWGPYKVTTYNGMNYFLTLVDAYSRWT
ncbi:hypothetical protein KY285_023057 [Solanum tuberosum]|nr:hypothetical protein KY285_023057 [Solanum tuberosum]